MSRFSQSSLVAVLGPTNTGKTHLAIERMCAHSSGMIGFPLRLLAREVYDRVVALKGANRVALVTGEEKIIPKDAQWYLCTAEAMPMNREFAFVAIDEGQIGIDPERGHIFTDRMLHARGRDETMILGSESLRSLIEALLPDAEIVTRPRFSTLSYAGPRKLSRLPRRSAIVAFSLEDVYAIAEMLRRQHGGAAIVMGSLSPQTRNAQVKMYQDGEVDYLVATDAIGMGLNLDVTHVAFAALRKFDGRRRRRLTLAEIGQIAGRAGRHQKDGSFGILSGLASSDELQAEDIERLEAHRFPKLEWLYWRNAEPGFGSIDGLIRSLEEKPQRQRLHAAPEAVDLAVLKKLGQDPAVSRYADSPAMVRLLWEAASIPDFRKVGADHQARFVASLWPHLASGSGRIPHARMAQEIARLENVQGDIATLGARIAAARSWSYIAQKSRWVEQPEAMVERTRALESRLSDAMHSQLTQRFVDKRTRILMRGLLKDSLSQDVAIDDDGVVLVEGQEIGTLKGFQFVVPSDSRSEDRKMLLAAAERYLGRIMTENADALAKAPDSVLTLVPDAAGQPAILWGDSRLAVLAKGKSLLQPEIKFDRSIKDMAPEASQKVIDRVKLWVDAMKDKHLQGLVKIDALANEPETPAAVRALFAQIVDAGGILSRREIDQAIRALDNDMRGHARRAGLVFGALDIFHHALMKPGAVLWRTALFAAFDAEPMIEQAPDNAVHLKQGMFASAGHASRLGFRKIADEYVRVDMVERLIKQAHDARQQGAIFAVDPALATSLGLSRNCHEALLALAGFVKTTDQPEPVAPSVADESPASESVAPSRAPETPVATETPIRLDSDSGGRDSGGPDSADSAAGGTAPADSAQNVASEAADTPAENVAVPEIPAVMPQYWRWKGMARRKNQNQFNARGKPNKQAKGAPAKRKVEPVIAKAGGAFAELAALRDSMKK